MSISFSGFKLQAPKRSFEEFKAKPGDKEEEETCEKEFKLVRAENPFLLNNHKIDWTYEKNVTNFQRVGASPKDIDFHSFPFIIDQYICAPVLLDKTISKRTQQVIDSYVVPTFLE